MCADDIKHDAASDVHFMTVIEDDEAGRSVKTETSLRAVPIHPELKRIGILGVGRSPTASGRSEGASVSIDPTELQGKLWGRVFTMVRSL